MLSSLSEHNRRFGLVIDLSLLFAGFYLTYMMTGVIKGRPIFRHDGVTYFETYVFIIIAWGMALLLAAEYPVRRLVRFSSEFWITLRVNVLAILFFSILTFILKYNEASRLFAVVYFINLTALMILVRWFIRVCLGFARKRGRNSRVRLILGTSSKARRYIETLDEEKNLGLRVIGYLGETGSSLPAPYLGNIELLPSVLAENPIDGVIIALPITDSRINWIIHQCELQGVSIELMLDGLSSRINSSAVVHTMDIPRLVLRSTPQTETSLVLKRITDIVISFILLVLLVPIILLIAIGIKLDDGGPVFFSQKRCSLHGRQFYMHKFRSMSVDAEKMKSNLQHLNEMSGPVFKIRNDPRVTRIGRVLRKLSLDEIPQIWDVFIGNMSLVGPRPPLMEEVEKYDIYQRRRLSVKPGITCIWQVSGRNDIDFDQWVNLDLEYIDNWSYIEDWRILLKTVPAVLWHHGAS